MHPNLRNLLSLIAGLVAFAVLACPIAPASAGEYDVWSCRGPAGEPLSTEAWVPRTFNADPSDVTLTDDCATGGPVTLTLNPGATATRRPRLEYGFDLPRGAKILSYRLLRGLRAAASLPGYYYMAAVSEVDGTNVHDFGCASGLAIPDWQCSFQGSLTDPDDPGNELVATAVSLDQLRVFVACVTTNGCIASPFGYAADVALFGATVTIEDDLAPTVTELSGSLTGTAPVDGVANLFVEASDDNAGISSFSLDVDGVAHQTIPVTTGTCTYPFVVASPCPRHTAKSFPVDTTGLSPGIHTATGTVSDAAGNQTAFAPVSFVVKDPDPGPPVPDNGIPAVTDPLVKFVADEIWQKPGSAAVIEGQLTTPAGLPVAGAVLGIRMTQLGMADPSETDRPNVTTGSDGRFSIPVPGSGARRVGITFAPYAGGPVTSKASIRVRSRLGLRLRRKPARIRIGRKVRFSGQLTGAGPSAAGVPVEIQAKVARKWQTVATVRTRSRGKWNWVYRFRYVKRNAIFSFRAIVRAAPGWPWPSIKSPVRKVRIKVRRR
jgi:hypothetical protein